MGSYAELFVEGFKGYAGYLWKQISFQADPWYENYFWFLLIISIIVWGLEVAFPWRKNQAIFRKDFWLDAFFIFFNFYIFNLIIFIAFSKVVYRFFVDTLGINPDAFILMDMSHYALWMQLLVLFVATDIVQWFTHYMLHRSPFLWRFHKVHHSVEQMGFAAHFRFHWMETVIYTPMKYIAVMLIGNFNPEHAFIVYAFTIAIGHLNHANLGWSYGPLKYLFNNPKMHIWHHSLKLPKERPHGMNYGISLSLWDYIFRTNYIPEDGRDIKLGFKNMDKYPKRFFRLIFSGFRKTPDEE